MSASEQSRRMTKEANDYLDKLGWDDELDRTRLWSTVGNFVLAKGHENRREMNSKDAKSRPLIEQEFRTFFDRVYVPQFLTPSGKARNESITMSTKFCDAKG